MRLIAIGIVVWVTVLALAVLATFEVFTPASSDEGLTGWCLGSVGGGNDIIPERPMTQADCDAHPLPPPPVY